MMKASKSKSAVFWLCTALILCLVGSMGAGLVQSSFRRVKVTDVVIETDTARLTGYLFVPPNASDITPAPAIVTSHGYLNNREMQDLNYVELSRRGYVVFAMDAYKHGDSSVPVDGKGSDISKKTGGMVDAVEYLATLSFVDSKKIGVTGHSMGGGFADSTAAYYTGLVNNALKKGASPQEAAALNKIAAALIIGNVPMGLMETGPYQTELGIIAGRYDEFFIVTLRDSVVRIFENPTAKQFFALQQGEDPASMTADLVEGERYVNKDTGFGIAMWSPWEIHPWNHFSRTTSAHAVEFFERSIGAPNPLPPGNQIWWLKELFNLIALAGFFLILVPLADLLLSTSFFKGLKAEESVSEVSRPVSRTRYIVTSVSNALLCAVLLIPLIAVGFLFMVNPFWPQDTTGGIALWSFGCGLAALLFVRVGGVRFIKNSRECGTFIKLKDLAKTVLLALTITAIMFSTVFVADWLFKTDFRIWSFAVRAFSADKVWVAVKYLPMFLVFYLANSLAVSRNRFEGFCERKQVLISVGFNILGVTLFVLLQYLPLLINGKTFFGTILSGPLATAGALFPILVFPFIPILGIAAVIGVKLYRRTGNIYLAGLTNAMIVTMLTVANTSFSFPY